MTSKIIYFSLIIVLLFAAAIESNAANFNFQTRSFDFSKRGFFALPAFNGKDTGDFKIGLIF